MDAALLAAALRAAADVLAGGVDAPAPADTTAPPTRDGKPRKGKVTREQLNKAAGDANVRLMEGGLDKAAAIKMVRDCISAGGAKTIAELADDKLAGVLKAIEALEAPAGNDGDGEDEDNPF